MKTCPSCANTRATPAAPFCMACLSAKRGLPLITARDLFCSAAGEAILIEQFPGTALCRIGHRGGESALLFRDWLLYRQFCHIWQNGIERDVEHADPFTVAAEFQAIAQDARELFIGREDLVQILRACQGEAALVAELITASSGTHSIVTTAAEKLARLSAGLGQVVAHLQTVQAISAQ